MNYHNRIVEMGWEMEPPTAQGKRENHPSLANEILLNHKLHSSTQPAARERTVATNKLEASLAHKHSWILTKALSLKQEGKGSLNNKKPNYISQI